jgi:hypothetical protein
MRGRGGGDVVMVACYLSDLRATAVAAPGQASHTGTDKREREGGKERERALS